jgi:hypothetical protein
MVEVDTSAVEVAINVMAQSLVTFPNKMADELTRWQEEDMRRTRGLNTAIKGNVVETIITQHTQPGQPRVGRAMRRRVRETRAAVAAVRVRTLGAVRPTKPILRQVLFEKLDERMKRLMLEELKWQ